MAQRQTGKQTNSGLWSLAVGVAAALCMTALYLFEPHDAAPPAIDKMFVPGGSFNWPFLGTLMIEIALPTFIVGALASRTLLALFFRATPGAKQHSSAISRHINKPIEAKTLACPACSDPIRYTGSLSGNTLTCSSCGFTLEYPGKFRPDIICGKHHEFYVHGYLPVLAEGRVLDHPMLFCADGGIWDFVVVTNRKTVEEAAKCKVPSEQRGHFTLKKPDGRTAWTGYYLQGEYGDEDDSSLMKHDVAINVIEHCIAEFARAEMTKKPSKQRTVPTT